MKKPINDGGPALPEHHYFDPSRGQYGEHITASDVGCGGMTLRDWFAGMALSGLVFHNDFGTRSDEEIASGAYSYADAMLAARRVKP